MNRNLWIVIIVVVGFLGFFFGYSMPSFLRSGGAAVEEKKPDAGPKLDKSAQDYYKDLQNDEQ